MIIDDFNKNWLYPKDFDYGKIPSFTTDLDKVSLY